MIQGYNPEKRWEILREEILERKRKFRELNVNRKIYSFLKYSVFPNDMRERFPYLIRNVRWDKPQPVFEMSFNVKELSPHNEFVVYLILRGFFMLFMAIYNQSEILFDMLEKKNRLKLYKHLYDFVTFSFFNNYYKNDYFYNNEILLDIIIGYIFDKNHVSSFFDNFNISILKDLKSTELLLNFENYKYEEDCIRYGPEKAEKLLMDVFEWDYLDYYDYFFFSFCIYEFYIYWNTYYFNYFNADFFNKVLVIENYFENYNKNYYQNIKNALNTNYIYNKKKVQSFLTTVYFDYDLEFLRLYKKNKRNNIIKNYRSLSNFKNNNFSINKTNFQLSKHILSIKDFGIRLSHVFFLLFTWYAIYYRRIRYNYYISSHEFYQEYPSRMYYFILANNPFGKNKTKISLFKHQKLLTLFSLSSYVENKTLNDWFYFYDIDNVTLEKIFYNNMVLTKFMFNNILINKNFIQFFKKDISFEYLDELHYSNLIYDESNFINFYGYHLLMQMPITKFTKHFRLGRLAFLDYLPMLETVYLLSYDREYLKYKLKIDLFFNFLYNTYQKFHNFYFLMDFYNIKNKKILNLHYKVLNFFDKIINIIFFLIDPFFFKFFWKRCFPDKWFRMWHLNDFVWQHMILIDFEDILVDFDLKKYDFICYFLQWRIDTTSFSVVGKINNAFLDKTNFALSMINTLYKNRFLFLLEQIKLILKDNCIEDVTSKLYLLFILKNYYFNLLMCNLDFILLLFFQDIKKNIKMFYNLIYKFNKNLIYQNFINRQYVFERLFETFFYDDWFYDWNKRILWIYKNTKNHEGPYFYSY